MDRSKAPLLPRYSEIAIGSLDRACARAWVHLHSTSLHPVLGEYKAGRLRSRLGGRTAMVLDLLLIGLAIALDPLPLTSFVVVLPSKRGVRKGAAFLFGWLVSLAIVVAVTVLATGNNPPNITVAVSLASLAVKIAIGAVLVLLAIRQRRRMGRPKPPKKPPKWQEHV